MKTFVTILLFLIIAGIACFIYFVENNNSFKINFRISNLSKLVDQPQKSSGEEINPEHFYCPVLLYHHIAEIQPQNSYYVSPEIFESQMKWLYDNGYHVISYDKFFQAATQKYTLPPKPVVITFDDGLKDQYTDAFPILKKYKFTATFFVKLNNFNQGGLTTQMAKEMIADGMIIGSHSVNHDDMAQMDEKTLYSELKDSKNYLEKTLGIEVKYFSYPGGAFSQDTVTAVKNAGYLSAVTTKHKVYQEIITPNSLYQIPRVHIDDEMPTFIDWVQGINLH